MVAPHRATGRPKGRPPTTRAGRPRFVTKERFEAAIHSLVKKKIAVTCQSLRKEMGGGSMSSIQPLLKTLREPEEQRRVELIKKRRALKNRIEAYLPRTYSGPPSVPEELRYVHIETPISIATIGGKERLAFDFYVLHGVYKSGCKSPVTIRKKTLDKIEEGVKWERDPTKGHFINIGSVRRFFETGVMYHETDLMRAIHLLTYIKWVEENISAFETWFRNRKIAHRKRAK